MKSLKRDLDFLKNYSFFPEDDCFNYDKLSANEKKMARKYIDDGYSIIKWMRDTHNWPYEALKKKTDNKKTEDNKKHKKDSEIFVDEFGKYLNELTEEEVLEWWEDIQ